MVDGQVCGDVTQRRIAELISNRLQKLAISPEYGAWEILYRDPFDGRYWELTYPQGEMHGGGPKQLRNLARATALAKYKIADDGIGNSN
jgi:hypothetical protein